MGMKGPHVAWILHVSCFSWGSPSSALQGTSAQPSERLFVNIHLAHSKFESFRYVIEEWVSGRQAVLAATQALPHSCAAPRGMDAHPLLHGTMKTSLLPVTGL